MQFMREIHSQRVKVVYPAGSHGQQEITNLLIQKEKYCAGRWGSEEIAVVTGMSFRLGLDPWVLWHS